jgi:anti-sigma28 factor (negative regulator of flagellin synthesis)
MDIIETKRTEASEKTKSLAKSQEIDRLQELLVVKQNEKLSEMSVEDIQKRIEELKQA